MGHVYLIGEDRSCGRYKIGSTRARDVMKRVSQIQVGNPCELKVICSYECDSPFKLEKMMHNLYKGKRLVGEWFELSHDDVDSFLRECGRMQGLINAMRDGGNPFV